VLHSSGDASELVMFCEMLGMQLRLT
jgi:hypothetical protein